MICNQFDKHKPILTNLGSKKVKWMVCSDCEKLIKRQANKFKKEEEAKNGQMLNSK